MRKNCRKIALVLLLAVFLVSTALWLRQHWDNKGAATAYEEALKVALQTENMTAEKAFMPVAGEETEESRWVPVPMQNDPVLEELAQINLAALREINPDVVGWIRIPGTKIDYPLMQGEDNEFYLNHTWQKEQNSVGSIFLECQNSADFTDYNTIVYGHNMNDGAMFADLENYALQTFWERNPYVYIVSDAGAYRYEIFAFFQPEVESLTYGMNPQRNDTKEKFLKQSLENSWIDTGITPETTDRILTLSTCSGSNYDYRYVVQARLPMMEVTK